MSTIPEPDEELDPGSFTIEDFLAWDRANPQFYRAFDHYAREALEHGHKRLSAWLIVNRIRWQTTVVAKRDDFKISNGLIAYYARMFMIDYPAAAGFFATKAMKVEPPVAKFIDRLRERRGAEPRPQTPPAALSAPAYGYGGGVVGQRTATPARSGGDRPPVECTPDELRSLQKRARGRTLTVAFRGHQPYLQRDDDGKTVSQWALQELGLIRGGSKAVAE